MHGIERAEGRNISKESIENAIQTAKEKGNVTTQTGKYGTPQNVYRGDNGITAIVETSGRNAGKVITVWSNK